LTRTTQLEHRRRSAQPTREVDRRAQRSVATARRNDCTSSDLGLQSNPRARSRAAAPTPRTADECMACAAVPQSSNATQRRTLQLPRRRRAIDRCVGEKGDVSTGARRSSATESTSRPTPPRHALRNEAVERKAGRTTPSLEVGPSSPAPARPALNRLQRAVTQAQPHPPERSTPRECAHVHAVTSFCDEVYEYTRRHAETLDRPPDRVQERLGRPHFHGRRASFAIGRAPERQGFRGPTGPPARKVAAHNLLFHNHLRRPAIETSRSAHGSVDQGAPIPILSPP
jgi:hypothetical protein